MESKLMVAEGYQISSEQELKTAIKNFISDYPDFIQDGISVKTLIKLYRKRTKPYRHIVFINMSDKWFIQFLTEEEILHRTNKE
jgi:hypothetical protein